MKPPKKEHSSKKSILTEGRRGRPAPPRCGIAAERCAGETQITALAILILSCTGNVAPSLQIRYCQAVRAWAPYKADIRRVKWCDPGECSEMGGGMFHYDSRVIAIDPNWPFKGNELLLTIEHEYGHALGLQHSWTNSIMKPGWDQPFAPGPTEEDFKELRKMYGARGH